MPKKLEASLVKISTYARDKNVSYETVRKWINSGKVESKVIDGVIFVVNNNNNCKTIKQKKYENERRNSE